MFLGEFAKVSLSLTLIISFGIIPVNTFPLIELNSGLKYVVIYFAILFKPVSAFRAIKTINFGAINIQYDKLAQ